MPCSHSQYVVLSQGNPSLTPLSSILTADSKVRQEKSVTAVLTFGNLECRMKAVDLSINTIWSGKCDGYWLLVIGQD